MQYSVKGLNQLSLEIAKWRYEKGFKTPDSIANPDAMNAKLMLVVSELAEACEAVRHGDVMNFKEEIADAFIRLFDIAGSYAGYNVEDEIQNKMAVNEGRPQLHGKNS